MIERDKELFIEKENALLEVGTGKYHLQSVCYKLFDIELISGDKEVRFDEAISHGEDGLFMFEVLHNVTEMIFSKIPKWNIFIRQNSASRSEYTQEMKTSLTAVNKMMSKV